MPTCLLVAAYGRKYLSVHDAHKDWKDGKDFRIVGGPYTSIRDMDTLQEMFSVITLCTREQTLTIWKKQ